MESENITANKELAHRSVSMLFMLAAVLVALFLNFSFAWFTRSSGATAEGMQVGAGMGSDIQVNGYTVYRYDQGLSFHADSAVLLRGQDMIYPAHNDKNAVVIALDTKGIRAGAQLQVRLSCRDADGEENALSDIISWRVAALTLPETGEELYAAARAAMETGDYPVYDFRTLDKAGTATKVTAVQSQAITVTEGSTIYILLDYSSDLIDRTSVAFTGQSDTAKAYEGDLTAIELVPWEGDTP